MEISCLTLYPFIYLPAYADTGSLLTLVSCDGEGNKSMSARVSRLKIPSMTCCDSSLTLPLQTTDDLSLPDNSITSLCFEEKTLSISCQGSLPLGIRILQKLSLKDPKGSIHP